MINTHQLFIISAVDQEHGIGKNGDLAWHFSSDMKHFKEITTNTSDPQKQHMVIMGKTTWISIPEKYRPLPGRKNVVLDFDPSFTADGAETATSFDEAFALADDSIESIFIIGGASVYKQMIDDERVDGVYLTRIEDVFDCDVFFPHIPDTFRIKQKLGDAVEKETSLGFYLYKKTI